MPAWDREVWCGSDIPNVNRIADHQLSSDNKSVFESHLPGLKLTGSFFGFLPIGFSILDPALMPLRGKLLNETYHLIDDDGFAAHGVEWSSAEYQRIDLIRNMSAMFRNRHSGRLSTHYASSSPKITSVVDVLFKEGLGHCLIHRLRQAR